MHRQWLYSILGLAGFLLVSYVIIIYGLPLVMPFVAALLIAEFINPLVNWLSHRARIPRTLSVSIILVILVGLISALLTAGIGYLVDEIEALLANLPILYAGGLDLSARFAEQFKELHDTLPLTIQEQINSNLTRLQDLLSEYLDNLAELLGVVTSLPSFLINVLIAFIATFFIARDRQEINAFLLSLFPVEWRPALRQVKTQVWSSAIGWGKAQLMLILLTMVQSIIGLSLIGASYAVLVGMAVGFVDVLPILGPGAIFLPWAIYSFLFGSKVFGVKLLILYGIVTGVRQVLESKVVGDQVGLHPLAVLLAIYLGITFFGALGVIFGPLMAILLKAMITSGLLPIFPDESRTKR
ncbi:MAG: sporulation integral membrane protein YtvI [Bacillota bacterium]